MAGKHVGAWQNTDAQAREPTAFAWNERTTKAYAEGRLGSASNGHPINSEAWQAYVDGALLSAQADQAFETGEGPGAPSVIPVFIGHDPTTLPAPSAIPDLIGDPIRMQSAQNSPSAQGGGGPITAQANDRLVTFGAIMNNSTAVTVNVNIAVYTTVAGPGDVRVPNTRVGPQETITFLSGEEQDKFVNLAVQTPLVAGETYIVCAGTEGTGLRFKNVSTLAGYAAGESERDNDAAHGGQLPAVWTDDGASGTENLVIYAVIRREV